MTYDGGDEDCGVVPVLNLEIGCSDGDYVRLDDREAESGGVKAGDDAHLGPSSSRVSCNGWCSLWWWVKRMLLFAFLGVLAGIFFKWIGPFVMDKEIIPLINWERATFSVPVLAFLLFASVALFPTLLIPSSPSMWVAGLTFGYGYGFLLIIAGASIGVSLPYVIGSLFYHKIQGWLERYPKKASIIRLAGEGDWFNQFRAVTLIRISPFPYMIYNYCAVATNVKYGPYFFGSLLGMIPDIFVSIYTGILIQTLADASYDQRAPKAEQIIFNVIGFCVAVGSTVIVTAYAKSRLDKLQMEEQLLLR